MITISHNEIVVTCLKALEALGFSYGEAEDGADAIGWLAVHGLSLPDDLLNRLDYLQPADSSLLRLDSESDASSTWDVQGATGLSCFPNLADYAFVKARSRGVHQVTIQNMADVDLIWPYLANIQRRGYDALIRWEDSNQQERLISFDSEWAEPECYVQEFQSSMAAGNIELAVSRSSLSFEGTQNPKIIRIGTKEGLRNNYQYRIENGIDIDKKLWERLTLIGKDLLVESTAESEKRGAGGV